MLASEVIHQRLGTRYAQVFAAKSVPMFELIKIRDELHAFAAERDWDHFPPPKSLRSFTCVHGLA
jgi:hypothetical protein